MTALAAHLRRTRRFRLVRDAMILAALALITLALFFTVLLVGETRVTSLGDVLGVLAGRDIPGASFTVGELRLPRAVGGALAGAAFGLAGTLFQTLLHNVLASPDVIGISAGASAAAVAAIGLFGASGMAVAGVSVAGSLCAALLVWVFASRHGLSGTRFVLVGVAVATALHAVIGYILARSDVRATQDATVWLTGSLSRSLWDQVEPTAPVLVVLIIAGVLASVRLAALRLGDDAAAALGVPVARARFVVIVVAVLLVAVATSLTGPIAFVAFLAGPIAVRLLRRAEAAPVGAALVGAAVVLGADLVAQHLLRAPLPVGIVTGVIGAPFLLFLLMKGGTRA